MTGSGALGGSRLGGQEQRTEAQRRWHLLRAAIKEKRSTLVASKFLSTPGAKSGLVRYIRLAGDTFRASCPGTDTTVTVRLPQSSVPLTPDQLMGFDNTGNICVWASEELLLHYCVSALPRWRGKHLLELAGGSTALAGLWVSAAGGSGSVTLTDGHPACVANIRRCVKENMPLSTPTHVRWLQWPLEEGGPAKQQHCDVILASDCVFSERQHAPLCDAVWRLLVEGGECVLCAPHRAGPRSKSSLTQFVALMIARGFRRAPADAVSNELLATAEQVWCSCTSEVIILENVVAESCRSESIAWHRPA